MTGNRWCYRLRANLPATLLMVWLLPFAIISVYWGLGGLWLVDTAVQDEGVQLAHERPAWMVILVLAVAVFKLGWIAWAFLIVALAGRRVPRWLYLLFGAGVGTGSLLYGMAMTAMALPSASAGPISERAWWLLIVWWPQFWVAGILTLSATIVFARTTKRGQQPPSPDDPHTSL